MNRKTSKSKHIIRVIDDLGFVDFSLARHLSSTFDVKILDVRDPENKSFTFKFCDVRIRNCLPHIKKNGLIVSDDIYWNNAFIDFAKKVNSQYTIFDGIGIIKKVS